MAACKRFALNCRAMGRSYWFECAKCGYRARVSGRADRGANFYVQTIVCRDCKELYDAVTRLRLWQDGFPCGNLGLRRSNLLNASKVPKTPPTFQSALSRLIYTGTKQSRWIQFTAQCPVASNHRVQVWNEPDKCPKCGLYLDRNALPYRIWE